VSDSTGPHLDRGLQHKTSRSEGQVVSVVGTLTPSKSGVLLNLGNTRKGEGVEM
jgi:hypothetical protein